ncbi:unnamed protein product, partial [Ascophyllum nodosum]
NACGTTSVPIESLHNAPETPARGLRGPASKRASPTRQSDAPQGYQQLPVNKAWSVQIPPTSFNLQYLRQKQGNAIGTHLRDPINSGLT